ncbi:gamma carbonic anhydrase family protein [Streptomyces sp. NBC_01497]|uniref:gamma carbonic anhydrase family protein n=1 Tax=Streptomyces sp. NBC_01497 TaxID=2903885 RepID=UPI002E2F71A9|nr:gamma carbonic anhydrase family protein [Streptomyces sp. NBC_01497]
MDIRHDAPLLLALGEARPEVEESAWIAPGARLLGEVTVGSGSSVWYGVVLRADLAPITIGRDSNLQDNAVVHNDTGCPTVLGDRVSVGHTAVVHGAVIGDDCLIGMAAVVMNRARIGAGTLVAAGAVVPEGSVVPPGSLVVGVPGSVRRLLRAEETAKIRHNAELYRELAGRHRAALS